MHCYAIGVDISSTAKQLKRSGLTMPAPAVLGSSAAGCTGQLAMRDLAKSPQSASGNSD